jgi:hypothetical protein
MKMRLSDNQDPSEILVGRSWEMFLISIHVIGEVVR